MRVFITVLLLGFVFSVGFAASPKLPISDDGFLGYVRANSCRLATPVDVCDFRQRRAAWIVDFTLFAFITKSGWQTLPENTHLVLGLADPAGDLLIFSDRVDPAPFYIIVQMNPESHTVRIVGLPSDRLVESVTRFPGEKKVSGAKN